MATSFVSSWTRVESSDGAVPILAPTLEVIIAAQGEHAVLETFLVDSGADISMASRRLCDELRLDWNDGEPIDLNGISPKPECIVPARVFMVEILIPDIGIALPIPICFADADTSQLIGRDGFFDCFRVTFDKQQLTTRFELIEE